MSEPFWKISLVGEATLLAELADALRDSRPRIVREGGRFFLSSQDWLAETPTATIEREATRIVNTLNGATRIAMPWVEPVQLGGEWIQRRSDGRTAHLSLIPTARIKVTALPPTTRILDEQGSVVVEQKPSDPIPDFLHLGLNDEAVEDVLRWWGSSEPGWYMLYKVFEVIRHECGGNQQLDQTGWMDPEDRKLFSWTADNPKAIGDEARHGVKKHDPPPNPMSLSRARKVIAALLDSWLMHKTQQMKK